MSIAPVLIKFFGPTSFRGCNFFETLHETKLVESSTEHRQGMGYRNVSESGTDLDRDIEGKFGSGYPSPKLTMGGGRGRAAYKFGALLTGKKSGS